MRMHSSCGKCSPNIVVGALLVFSVIVLYNYWTVSVVNRDLLLRIHSLEQQALSLVRTKELLQTNIEKVEEEKSGLQSSVHKVEALESDLKQQLKAKENSLKDVLNELERAKKSSQTLRDELTSRKEASQKEISELKEKVVSLEAQVMEKSNSNDELREQLESKQKALDIAERKLKMGAPPTSAKSTTKADDPLAQPVLLNDPAVPYPNGWMDPKFSRKNPNIHLSHTIVEGDRGLRGHNSPVIIFDPPTAKKTKARFSVLDPPKPNSIYFRPEQQMNPEVIPGAGLPSIKSDKVQDDTNNAAENGVGAPGGEISRDGIGVLPVPGAGGENLDAAEDDGDHQLKEDGTDQSPDGILSAKEMKDSEPVGVVQAPPKGESGIQDPAPGHGGQSGQDVREAAHLADISLHNNV